MEEFSLASVVVPAEDGTLQSLGHDVRKLGMKALGIVTENAKSKARVLFPELSLGIWLKKSELADVLFESQRESEGAFGKIVPNWESSVRDWPLVWLIHYISQSLDFKSILGVECASELSDLWEESESALKDYFGGDVTQPAVYLSLAITELKWEQWKRLELKLGERLLFARFLPAGMHKLELALYLKE